VKASLHRLISESSLFAAPNAHGNRFRDEFIEYTKESRGKFRELKKTFSLHGRAFNSGVMTFSTELINESTFHMLLDLYRHFGELNKYGEEGTLNLFFYKKWKKLPACYNVYPYYTWLIYGIPYETVDAAIFHFVGGEPKPKPWFPDSLYYKEWMENLRKADTIDPRKPQEASRIWTPFKEKRYDVSLALRHPFVFLKRKMFDPIPTTFYTYIRAPFSVFLRYLSKIILNGFFMIDRQIGKLGLVTKKISPRLYEYIRIKKQ
jgi:lipopolysaccharide biosynthesis glycosyltransferase